MKLMEFFEIKGTMFQTKSDSYFHGLSLKIFLMKVLLVLDIIKNLL